jgi:glycosyltransferase involved in cell wall biosynthesis
VAPPLKAPILGRIYRFFLKKLHSPDAFWTWKGAAIRKASKIIQHHQIDVIMTSSSPFTTLEIGNELRKKWDVRWVADFRDPLSYDQRLHSKDPNVFHRQKEIEAASIRNADAITTLTSAHPLIFADLYGPEWSSKIHYIPTGLDRTLLPVETSSSDQKPYFIFIGEYLPQYGSEFFRILRKALNDSRIQEMNIKLKIVGRRELNELRVGALSKDCGLEQVIEFVDHVPQREVYKLIQNSLAAVICTSRFYPWWTSFAKVVDYIALKKPVITVVPNPSEARKWLQLTNLGVFLDGNIDECAEILKKFILNPKRLVIAEDYQRQFYADFQVEEFERIFLNQPPAGD